MANVRKNPAVLLALLYAIFILYGTTIPFDLTLDATVVNSGIDAIRWTPFQRVTGMRESLPDMATNFLLFIPLGALLAFAGYRSRRFKYNLIALILAILASGTLSALVEALQIYSPTRVTSITDLMINIGGAACGAMASFIFYRWARDPLLSWCRREIDRSILAVDVS
ncbi:VanZ family protein, partial [Candidatus Zixiibacteriota bacterium]